MKKTFCFVLAFAGMLIIACNNPKKDVNENPYVGAWEITYSKYVYPDSTDENTHFDNPSVKILTKKHFSFGSQAGENRIIGGGGEYVFGDATYTENVKYHAYSDLVGRTVTFKSTFKDDLWTISGTLTTDSLKVELTEIWKRIE
jgi:hypothetical protein